MKKRRWILIALLALVLCFSYGCGDAGVSSSDQGKETTEANDKSEEKTQLKQDQDSSAEEETGPESATGKDAGENTEAGKDGQKKVTAVIDIKDYGKITLELDPDAAPITVENFVKLAKDGFYDGLTFHRIMDGFMIQGGDPQGNGTGGSAETIKGEFSQNGVDNTLSHVRGTISMARSQDPDSASSQFFIVQSDSKFLDGQYAAFGKVTEGIEIVDQICKDALPVDDNGTIPADEQPVINSITIQE